jgi:hypoxanthine phosphoribosyltransferase
MQVVPLFSGAEVQARIAELAARIYRDYADSRFSVLCIAQGATRFAEALTAELVKHGLVPAVHSVRARRARGTTLGAVQLDAFDPSLLDGRDVLVVGDIVDEGATLEAVLDIVAMAEARSVRTAVLSSKREQRRDGVEPDYTGFEVDGGWIVGFGMDIDGELRELDEIGVVVEES